MPENVEELIQQGLEYLRNAEWQLAERNFRVILNVREVPYVRTKLAMACYMQERYEEAWAVLEPNLTAEVMEPYARAWAAELCRCENRILEARKFLKDGIRQYEWGTTNIEAMGISPEIWHYAAVVLKKVAGTLDDHELVLDLQDRWTSYPPFLEDYYLAGIAYFNLYQYENAVDVWRKFQNEGFSPGEVLITGTRLIQGGAVPHFPLEYSLPSYSPYLKDGQVSVEQLGEGGVVRLLTMGALFGDPDLSVEQGELVRLLVNVGGSWGLALAKSVMETTDPSMTEDVKMAALYGLVDRGICNVGQEVSMVIDGRLHTVIIEEQEDEHAGSLDSEMFFVILRAENMMEQGEYEEALELLQPLIEVRPNSVELLQCYGRVLVLNNDMAEAVKVAQTLFRWGEDNPIYRLFAALLACEAEDLDLADKYVNSIDCAALPEDLQGMYHYLKEVLLKLAYLGQGLGQATNERILNEQLNKVLPKSRTLKGLLRTLSVEWLDLIYYYYDLPPFPRRPEREKALADYLLSAPAAELLTGLSGEALDLFQYLLNRQGFSRMGPITRKYGSFQEESFFDGNEPTTVVGELVIHGLAFVGTVNMDGRSFKGVVIPRELAARFT